MSEMNQLIVKDGIEYKLVWYRFHFEDVDGLVPTDECDWWEYDSFYTEIENDPIERAELFVNKRIEQHRVCYGGNRMIFHEVIDKPPRWYVDQEIAGIKKSMEKKSRKFVKDNQQVLAYYESILRSYYGE